MTGMTHLALAYIGMITALGIWTWTVLTRSRDLEARINALEQALSEGEE